MKRTYSEPSDYESERRTFEWFRAGGIFLLCKLATYGTAAAVASRCARDDATTTLPEGTKLPSRRSADGIAVKQVVEPTTL